MNIGKLVKINPRSIWVSESRDFTPWIAQNIEYLNEVLGLDLTVLSTEANVGPYKVDIYGEDNFGSKVIIENQLEKTDHTHLGQILTYMVNLDATTAIWIAINPIEEHRKVVEWLNETTPDNMSFYLVRIEAVQFEGESSVAPLFTVIECPTTESKKIGSEKKDFARRHTVRKDFWAQFIAKMNESSSLLKNISPSTDSWIGAALGASGISLNYVVTKNYARTEIYINKGDTVKNKDIYDSLFSLKEVIESRFGGELTWERMDDRVTSRIKYQLDGVNVFDESDWDRIDVFLIDASTRMYAAFKDAVSTIKR